MLLKVVQRNKGFTLTELIAVIVILAILISISTVTFISVRKNILRKQYEELVMYLETKAEEFANDTNIIVISVEDLIKEGYVNPDDQANIYNPETKESMNCYIIKSVFRDGKYEAKLSENLGSVDGKCNSYVKTKDIEICRYDGENCFSIGKDEWFKEDINLRVKYRNSILAEGNITYNWTSTNGFTSKDPMIKTNTELVSHNTYKCELTIDNVYGEANSVVGIDKQAPKINNVTFDDNWSTSKEVVIDATDMGGSGIKGYGFDTETCEEIQKDNKFIVTIGGTYSYCVVDKAGNVTSNKVKVDKINSIPTKPIITADDGVLSNDWHIKGFTLSFYSNIGEGLGKAKYFYGTSENDLNNNGDTVFVDENSHGVTYYVKACNSIGVCGDVNNYIVKIDKGKPNAPTITASDGITSGNWHRNGFTLNIGGSSAPSGIIYYYGLNSNDVNTVGTSAYVSEETKGTTYYARACNGLGVCSDISSYVAKIDKTTYIAPPKITASDGITSGNWHRQNFSLSFSGSSAPGGVTYYYGTRFNSLNYSGTSTHVNNETNGTTYYVKACNSSGFCSDASTYVVKLDRNENIAAPIITASDGITSGNWHKSNFTLTFSGSKSVSGITYYYGISKSSLNTRGTNVNITNETSGTTYYVKACNGFNNCSSISSYLVKLDKVSPSVLNVSLHKKSYYGNTYVSDTWTSDDVYIVLSYSKSDVSGIEKYQYSNDNYRWYDVSGDRMYVSTSGVTNIYFRAVDKAGNVGASSSKYIIKIDRDIPAAPNVKLTFTKYGGSQVYKQETWVNTEIKGELSYSKSDASGIAKYQYSYDNSNWTDISGSTFVNKKEGKNSVYFRALDKAGNVGKASSAYKLYYDKTAPGRIYSVNVKKGSKYGSTYYTGNWSAEPLYIMPSYSSYDLSGLAGFSFSLDKSRWSSPTDIYRIDKVGQSTVYIKAVDNAGNEGPIYTLSNLKVSKYLADYGLGLYIYYQNMHWRIVAKSGSGSTGKVTAVSAKCIGNVTLQSGVGSSVSTAKSKINVIADKYKRYNEVNVSRPIREAEVSNFSRYGGTVDCDYFAYPSSVYANYITFVSRYSSNKRNYTEDYVKKMLTRNISGGTRVVLEFNSGVYTTTSNDGGNISNSLTITK